MDMFSVLTPHDICENSDISRIAPSHLVKVLGLLTSLTPARLYFFASLHLCSRFVLSLLTVNIGCSVRIVPLKGTGLLLWISCRSEPCRWSVQAHHLQSGLAGAQEHTILSKRATLARSLPGHVPCAFASQSFKAH